MRIKKTTAIGPSEEMFSRQWLNARDLYRDLGKHEAYEPFTGWFTNWIEGYYNQDEDWKVEFDGDGEPVFWITQKVADEVAFHDRGLPLEQVRRPGMYPESGQHARRTGWSHEDNPQTHAITGDEEI